MRRHLHHVRIYLGSNRYMVVVVVVYEVTYRGIG